MRTQHDQPHHSIFGLAGWLFADLLLVLTLIFLAAAAPWTPTNSQAAPSPTPTPTPTPAPVICGLATTPQVVMVRVGDPNGIRNRTDSAQAGIGQDLERAGLPVHSGRAAGFVEVFGGSDIPEDGARFAAGAIEAMQRLANRGTIFSSRTVYFRPLWNGTIGYDQLEVNVFYFTLSKSCG